MIEFRYHSVDSQHIKAWYVYDNMPSPTHILSNAEFQQLAKVCNRFGIEYREITGQETDPNVERKGVKQDTA